MLQKTAKSILLNLRLLFNKETWGVGKEITDFTPCKIDSTGLIIINDMLVDYGIKDMACEGYDISIIKNGNINILNNNFIYFLEKKYYENIFCTYLSVCILRTVKDSFYMCAYTLPSLENELNKLKFVKKIDKKLFFFTKSMIELE